MLYTAIFHGYKKDNFQMKNCDFFLIFAKSINCGYSLEPPHEAVLTSTHNLCFRAKIRKNVYPCKPHFYYIKEGCKGVYITRTCYPDDILCWIVHAYVLLTLDVTDSTWRTTYFTF